MDESGWHALRQAEAGYHQPPERDADGSYRPLVTVNPMNEPFVGSVSQPPHMPQAANGGWGPPPGPPPGFPQPSSSRPPPQYHAPSYHPLPWMPDGQPEFVSEKSRPPLSAAERANSYAPLAKMEPHLQFLCGPLLRYDTVINDVWHGAVMIVTADAGSIYSPHPQVSFEWDPTRTVKSDSTSHSAGYYSSPMSQSPLQTSPYGGSPYSPQASQSIGWLSSPNSVSTVAYGQELWVYHGPYGSCTFWRMMVQIPLSENEMCVSYSVNNGHRIQFYVPGKGQEMRWATYSCNGFSAGVNADDFRGPGHASGFDPLWSDLLKRHSERPFHALVGGGDQLYCDSLMREPELQEFINLKTGKEKVAYQLTDAIRVAVDRFYFSHYCLVFRNGKFAHANSTIPMVNMLDDHDMIDGFGSYPEDLQRSPLFQLIGDRAYHFFLLFQCFVIDSVDGVDPHPGRHRMRSMLIGGPGAWIPYPSHSLLTYLGPSTWMIMLDCRAERKLSQVCSEGTYRRVFERLWDLPLTVKHLVVQLGIPIAYPRMNFLEKALESPLNPFIALGKQDKLGLGSLVNKFNKDAELLDDLMDHWTAKPHKQERNWLVQQLQNFALMRRIRVTFLSGDVHVAAVGVFKTLSPLRAIDPVVDHRYMLNVVTSAIVNTPPPIGVLTMVASLSDKTHKTMHSAQTDECMIPLFQTDTNGQPNKSKNIMGRRNYTIVEYNHTSQELRFEIRVEKEKGVGDTVGYWVGTPQPGWQPPR